MISVGSRGWQHFKGTFFVSKYSYFNRAYVIRLCNNLESTVLLKGKLGNQLYCFWNLVFSHSLGADETNDKTSLDRALDHSLFLVLKNQDSWTLPMSHNEKGESLRESAERALALHEINAHVIGK